MSEEFSMDEVVLDEVTEEVNNKRPVFLLVLCILTWFWSGVVSIGGGISSILMHDKRIEEYKQSREVFNNQQGISEGEEIFRGFTNNILDSADSFIEHSQTLNYITVLTGVLCVLGAFLMFKLKRIGYYVYVVSTLFFIIAPIYLVGNNLLAISTTIFYGFFGLVFIILYGVNFKHLK